MSDFKQSLADWRRHKTAHKLQMQAKGVVMDANLGEDQRIPGVIKFGRAWAIPKDAIQPNDGRVKAGKYRNWRKRNNSET